MTSVTDHAAGDTVHADSPPADVIVQNNKVCFTAPGSCAEKFHIFLFCFSLMFDSALTHVEKTYTLCAKNETHIILNILYSCKSVVMKFSIPISQVASRRAARHQLTIPRRRLSTYGRRAFAVAGPTMFNTLPDDLRDPAVSTSTFRQSLKTHLFSDAYQHV